eukprot:CAMPEP_0172709148 /NCGR_PEP_ID=MMETSP1074-20121228/53573_1 /TAXON_ID=2916 /ORGANISM="Ceratium fusus, Strain PA161109" /LENGTH=58 /DNA_ID=CAMNT_0013532309 /DNA_START=12 /DNA_END=188 /DNA_ORIENTATION=+
MTVIEELPSRVNNTTSSCMSSPQEKFLVRGNHFPFGIDHDLKPCLFAEMEKYVCTSES